MKLFLLLGLVLFVAFSTVHADSPDNDPRVLLTTSHGDITLRLFAEKAPATVENFLGYVDSGFYDGTIFHRVIDGFMIQGGGFTADMAQKPTGAKIQNEADNGIANSRLTIAMARTNDPHSATAQFFINTANNAALNHSSKDVMGWGYAVFGEVIDGVESVDVISKVRTATKGGHGDVPVEPITITKAERLAVAAD